MKSDIFLYVFFGLTIVSIVYDMVKHLKFNRGVSETTILLLKHKNFRTYSLNGIYYGLFCVLLEILRFRMQSNVLNIMVLLSIVLLNVSGIFQYTNFTAISESGVWLDGKLIKWNKIELIDNYESGFVLTVKDTEHMINVNDFENKEEFKRSFTYGIRRFNHIESGRIKIL